VRPCAHMCCLSARQARLCLQVNTHTHTHTHTTHRHPPRARADRRPREDCASFWWGFVRLPRQCQCQFSCIGIHRSPLCVASHCCQRHLQTHTIGYCVAVDSQGGQPGCPSPIIIRLKKRVYFLRIATNKEPRILLQLCYGGGTKGNRGRLQARPRAKVQVPRSRGRGWQLYK
jgi:hypothetical protein